MNYTDEWQCIIDLMDFNSIQILSSTNKKFSAYVKKNEERIYKRLLLNQYPCINGYKDLYQLLEGGNIKNTRIYKKKCIKEGYFSCKTLMNDINKFDGSNVKVLTSIKYFNSIILCVEDEVKTQDTNKLLKTEYFSSLYKKINDTTPIINNRKSVNNKEKAIWNEWYPIALHKLGSIYSPRNKLL